jgi:NADPH:quinone reductase
LTGDRGVDVVFDGVGKATFEKDLDCLRPRGLLVSFGNASGVVSIPELTILARKGSLYVTRPTSAHYVGKTEDMRTAAKAVFDAVLDGTLRVSIGQKFPLTHAAGAHRAAEARETTGSTILLP